MPLTPLFFRSILSSVANFDCRQRLYTGKFSANISTREGIKREKDILGSSEIRPNCIKTLDFSISIYVIMLQSYIKALTCSWYVAYTYHSPVNVHVTATYFIRRTLVFWSILGKNCYGADTFLPNSYSRSESLFLTRSVATNLVTSLEFQPIRCAIMLCDFGQTRNGYIATYFIFLSSTAASRATSGYIVIPEHLGQNEEPAGSDGQRTTKKARFVPKVELIDAIVFPSM